MHVGQHARERSALCPHLPICEYPVARTPLLYRRTVPSTVVHRHGDARAPHPRRPLQSVFSHLRVRRGTDRPSVPIRADTSPRLCPRHLSQRLHRGRARPLYKATPGNSPQDIFSRRRRRGQRENGRGRRRWPQRASRIATSSSSGTTDAAPDGSRTAKVGIAYFLLDSST